MSASVVTVIHAGAGGPDFLQFGWHWCSRIFQSVEATFFKDCTVNDHYQGPPWFLSVSQSQSVQRLKTWGVIWKRFTSIINLNLRRPCRQGLHIPIHAFPPELIRHHQHHTGTVTVRSHEFDVLGALYKHADRNDGCFYTKKTNCFRQLWQWAYHTAICFLVARTFPVSWRPPNAILVETIVLLVHDLEGLIWNYTELWA